MFLEGVLISVIDGRFFLASVIAEQVIEPIESKTIQYDSYSNTH
jgi:hypothetical protein